MFTDPSVSLHVAGKACSMSFWNGRKNFLPQNGAQEMDGDDAVCFKCCAAGCAYYYYYCWIVVGMSNGKPPSDVPRRAN